MIRKIIRTVLCCILYRNILCTVIDLYRRELILTGEVYRSVGFTLEIVFLHTFMFILDGLTEFVYLCVLRSIFITSLVVGLLSFGFRGVYTVSQKSYHL